METEHKEYSHLGLFDEQIENEITGKKKQCTPVPISCHQENGAYGLWLDVDNSHLLLNPIEFFNTIFQDSERLNSRLMVVDGQEKSGWFDIDVVRERYMYSLSLTSPGLADYARQYHMQDAYVNTLKAAITDLYEKMQDGYKHYYADRQLSLDALKVCVDQFEVKATLPTYYIRRTTDVVMEEFIFKPKDSDVYTIGIGNRTYTTYLTHWSFDMEYLRHQLEELVFTRKTTLELEYEDSPTIIKLFKTNILDHTEQVGGGTAFKYKDYMYVEIWATEFANMPVVMGYCDAQATLRSIYEGLLRMALLHPEKSQDYLEPDRIVAYNRYKSPIFESILDGRERMDGNQYMDRQVHIKNVLTIDPNYDYFMTNLEGHVWNYDEMEDLCGGPVNIEGLKEWCLQIKPAIIDAAISKEYPMDWKEYHRKGVELAKQIRSVLPKKYDLWYDVPFEDKSGIIKKPLLII